MARSAAVIIFSIVCSFRTKHNKSENRMSQISWNSVPESTVALYFQLLFHV